jgi:hypothetical protein
MQCILYKIYFWKVFHMYYNLICIFICTPMWTKEFYSCKKWVLHRDPADLCNVIDTKRHNWAWTSSPHRCSPAQAPTPLGSGSFHALAPELRQVAWPDKFKNGSIDKYDGSNNPEEFIQVYHIVIEATRGNDQVKADYLPMTLSSVARSWLINIFEGTI